MNDMFVHSTSEMRDIEELIEQVEWEQDVREEVLGEYWEEYDE